MQHTPPKNKTYTSQFKFNAVLEAIAGGKPTEVARRLGITHSVLSTWKGIFYKSGHHIFENRPDKEREKMRKDIAKLEQMVGKKEVELNLLKNFSDFYLSQNTP